MKKNFLINLVKGMLIMLKENAFISSKVPRRDLVIWADRKTFKQKLLSFLWAGRRQWTEVLLIRGNYGSGKSHALIYAHMLCKSKGIPSVLIFNPGSSFMDLARRIIDAIGFDEILLACNFVLEKDKRRILKELEKKNLSGILKLEGLTTDRMIKFAFPEIDANFALILGQAYNNRNIDLCRAWLLGKQMTATELGRLNVSRSISSDDYAVKILSDTLRIILSKYDSFVLLLDELEDLANLSKSTALSYMKSLRRLIDENIPGLKIIVTFTDDAFENFQKGTGEFQGKSYQALYDRLAPGIILDDLTFDETVQFIRDHISILYNGPLEDIITMSSIKKIYDRLSGRVTPRNLINVCYEIFDKAIKENRWPIHL